MQRFLEATLTFVVLAVAACTPSKADEPAKAAEPAVAAAADTDIARDAIGVAECDAYIRAMNECYLPTLAPAERDAILAPMKQDRLRWKAADADPATVAAECKQALAARADVLQRSRCL